jgi:ribonucleoside-diphosphate reductase alpha chain
MREVVEQAANRQPFIDQAQSINLFFATPISGKYLNDVHMLAWKRGMKSLYYLRSASAIEAGRIASETSTGTSSAPVRDLANEEVLCVSKQKRPSARMVVFD